MADQHAGPAPEAVAPAEGFLWTGWSGVISVDAIADICVIDRCAASVRDLTFRVPYGGERTYGTRPGTPAADLIRSQQRFFTDLRESVRVRGVLLPVLLWRIGSRFYIRYGASRVWAARQTGQAIVPCVICDFTGLALNEPGLYVSSRIQTPDQALGAFNNPRVVGSFEFSRERLDAHRMELDERRVEI